MGRGAAGAGPEPVATAKRGETGADFCSLFPFLRLPEMF